GILRSGRSAPTNYSTIEFRKFTLWDLINRRMTPKQCRIMFAGDIAWMVSLGTDFDETPHVSTTQRVWTIRCEKGEQAGGHRARLAFVTLHDGYKLQNEGEFKKTDWGKCSSPAKTRDRRDLCGDHSTHLVHVYRLRCPPILIHRATLCRVELAPRFCSTPQGPRQQQMTERTVTFRSNDDPLPPEPGLSQRSDQERRASNPAKRKQTLLALLSELSDLRDTEDLGQEIRGSTPNDGNNGPQGNFGGETAQDTRTREGVAVFRAFDNHISNLDRQLQSFANSIRQLGSSVGLLNATYYLRASLIQIEYLFRENAADLFVEVRRKRDYIRGGALRNAKAERDRVHTGMRPQVRLLRDVELLPQEMDKLAQQIHVFVNKLNDIPEFTDELVNASFISFAHDLRYRASCLREFSGQLKTIAVQRYINDLSTDIALHMESMNEALINFVEVGVPTIRHAQTHTANGLQYLSAVATFFSIVTATTIQYSFDQTGNTLADLVNALWIISLVFSIASAINSQLAYHWRAAIYRSPRSYVPWWVSIWINRSPLFFLIGAVLAFSIGLCVFTYSSHQNRVVSALVTAFTIVTSSGLISVGLWFMSERWVFSQTRGKRWLFDILNDFQAKVNKLLGITWLSRQLPKNVRPRLMRWTRLQLHNIKTAFQSIYIHCTCRRPVEIDEEKQGHLSEFAAVPPSGRLTPRASGARLDGDTIMKADMTDSALESPRLTDKQPLPTSTSMTGIPSNSDGHPRDSPPGLTPVTSPPTITEGEPQRPGTKRLKSLVERVIAINKSAPGRTVSGRTNLEPVTGLPRGSSEGYIPSSLALKARIQKLKPGLETLRITQLMTEHMALVKHMEFSPNVNC
ncbi:unnamed protein product, partial [Rhizoctonia solani]